MRKAWLLGLIVTGLLTAMAGTRWLTKPLEVRAENAAGQFDARRAKARLARIIGPSPAHPADSASSDGVRARLVAEIRALGLQPRVDDRFACNKLHKASGVSCARVRNVLVTIGPATGPHLLVNTHYDSVPVGPGASDAGIAVASMLEAAFLLKDRPLARPITFLFNEGEELGLIGARAFLDGDPLSRRVDALINLEARGTTGPVNMFETSVPNAAAVRLFGQAVNRPVANSLAVSAYRLIPNYTDVNTFVEERDWLFLNFAPIGNETRYHSPGDDLAAVDLATLQHMGDQLLETGMRLGASPASAASDDDMLFKNVGTRFLFSMPSILGVVLGGVAGLLLLLAVVREQAWVALALLAGALVAGTALAYAGLSIVGALREGQFWRAVPKAAELAIYAGVIAAGLANLSRFRLAAAQWRSAWWLLFLLLGGGLAAAAPGALIYFVLPAFMFGLAALLRDERIGMVASLTAALLVFVTLGAMLGLLQELLNGGPLWIFAVFGGLILMPWLIEARPLLERAKWRRVVPAALTLAVLAWVPAALLPAYSVDRQQQWTTQYVLEEGRPPVWSIVNDRKPLPLSFASLGDWQLRTIPLLGSRQRWVSSERYSQGGALVPAEITVLESRATAGGRLVRLKLAANGANSILLRFPAGRQVRAMGVPGQVRPMPHPVRGPATLTCTGRSCDGREFALLLAGEPVTIEVIGTWWGLPEKAAPLLAARPQFARPQYLPDATIAIRQVRV